MLPDGVVCAGVSVASASFVSLQGCAVVGVTPERGWSGREDFGRGFQRVVPEVGVEPTRRFRGPGF